MVTTVRVTLKHGVVEAEALGVTGRGCETAVDEVLRKINALPGPDDRREPKPEFFAMEGQQEAERE